MLQIIKYQIHSMGIIKQNSNCYYIYVYLCYYIMHILYNFAYNRWKFHSYKRVLTLFYVLIKYTSEQYEHNIKFDNTAD